MCEYRHRIQLSLVRLVLRPDVGPHAHEGQFINFQIPFGRGLIRRVEAENVALRIAMGLRETWDRAEVYRHQGNSGVQLYGWGGGIPRFASPLEMNLAGLCSYYPEVLTASMRGAGTPDIYERASG